MEQSPKDSLENCLSNRKDSFEENFFKELEKFIRDYDPDDLDEDEIKEQKLYFSDNSLEYLFNFSRKKPSNTAYYGSRSSAHRNTAFRNIEESSNIFNQQGKLEQAEFEQQFFDSVKTATDKSSLLKKCKEIMKFFKNWFSDRHIKFKQKRHVATLLYYLLHIIFWVGCEYREIEPVGVFENEQDSDEKKKNYVVAAPNSSQSEVVVGAESPIACPEKDENVKESFSNLFFCLLGMLSYVGSVRESYVFLIGLLQEDRICVTQRCLVLPVLAKILRLFATKRAAFLVSANSTIFSVFFKQVNQAAHFDKVHQNIQSSKNTEKYWGEVPFYINWLLGVTKYVIKYLETLGDVCWTAQEDDGYSVGSNSCGCLLSKILVVYALSIEVLRDRPTNSQEVCASTAIKWNPLDTPEISSNKICLNLSKWVNRSSSKAFQLLQRILLLMIRIFHSNYVYLMESVNTVTPLDDGSGDLEFTPFSISLFAYFLCHGLVNYSADQHLSKVKLPLLLTPRRLARLGLMNSYVLMQCGLKSNSATEALPTLMVLGSSDNALFEFRRKRASDFGLTLFRWSTMCKGIMENVEESLFQTIFTFVVEPNVLLPTVLSLISQRSSDIAENDKKELVNCIKIYLHKYSFPLRLKIYLWSLFGFNLTGEQIDKISPNVSEVILHFFKQDCVDYLQNIDCCRASKDSGKELSQMVFAITTLTATLLRPYECIFWIHSGATVELLNLIRFIFTFRVKEVRLKLKLAKFLPLGSRNSSCHPEYTGPFSLIELLSILEKTQKEAESWMSATSSSCHGKTKIIYHIVTILNQLIVE